MLAVYPSANSIRSASNSKLLINILNDEYGIFAHRTTVTKDIAALQEFGMDIVTIHSTQSKYFVASRKFELLELKLLIDAVESSKFITKKRNSD